MTLLRKVQRLAAVLSLVVAWCAVSSVLPASADGSTGSSPANPVLISSVPYVDLSSFPYTEANGGAENDVPSALVAQQCAGGGQIYGATWWLVEPASATALVFQSAHNTFNLLGTFQPMGAAVLNSRADQVLACATSDVNNPVSHSGPVVAGPGQPVLLVTFEASAVSFGAPAVAVHPSTGVVPANLSSTTATRIPALPFDVTQDTTLAVRSTATTDPPIPGCYSKFGSSAAVWYSWTSPRDDLVDVSTLGTNYSNNVSVVAVGSPDTSPQVVSCGGRFPVVAGTTYLISVAGEEWVPDSGLLRLSVRYAPPLPALTVSIDPRGTVANKTGVAKISGTLTCSADELSPDPIRISGTMRQQVKRYIGTSDFISAPVACRTEPLAWSATVLPTTLMYGPGDASVKVSVVVCNSRGCATATADAVVRLKFR